VSRFLTCTLPACAAVVAALGLAIWSGAHAADAAAGRNHYPLCQTCHGDRGQGQAVSEAPRLAGQYEWYLARQLKNFRAGVRGAHPDDTLGAQMAGMAKTLPSEQAVANVAAYIAGFETLPAPKRTETSGDPERGRKHYAVCQTCHGVKAEGSPAQNAPRLAGQYDWYLIRQIKNFRAGVRGAHADDTFGAQMAPMAKTLPSEQAVLDVVAYIATLR